MQFIKSIGSNIIYIIWFAIYFTIAWVILGGTQDAFILALIIYGTSITIALCPIGEVILRLIENCRLPATQQENAYLMPLFEEVYQDAKVINPALNNGIRLYVMDALYVNAFAIGRKTIAVTRGAIESFTADELKGILAHELGHITYGHTKALLLTFIGNFFFVIIVKILNLLLWIIESISSAFAFINVVGAALWFLAFIIRIVFNISVIIFVNLGEIILAINSRFNEKQADRFAYDTGYGKELISALYLIQKISVNTKVSLSEKIKASHPHIAYRIGDLEKLEELDYTA